MNNLYKRLTNFILVALISISISGCVLLPPADLPLSDLPAVIGQGCEITVIRPRIMGMAGLQQYITFDGTNIARLHGGEYTKFLISEGHHTIGVIWQFLGFVGCGNGTCGGVGSREYYQEVEMECHAAGKYFYAIKFESVWSDANRFTIEQVSEHDSNFQLENKIFVPAGTSKEQ